jgi:cobalt-precorrin-7 (C5)-methyltransferase
MEMNQPRILIVGCGPGSAACVSPEARGAAFQADVLVGAPRLLDLFRESSAERIDVRGNVPATLEAVARNRGRRIVVLVSGDPGIASLATSVLQHFGRDSCRVIPGVSSVQVAFARLGLDWIDARILSAHGNTPDIEISTLSRERKIAVLAGSNSASGWAADVAEHLGAAWQVFVAKNLTFEDERVYRTTPAALREGAFPPLTIFLFVRRDCL